MEKPYGRVGDPVIISTCRQYGLTQVLRKEGAHSRVYLSADNGQDYADEQIIT